MTVLQIVYVVLVPTAYISVFGMISHTTKEPGILKIALCLLPFVACLAVFAASLFPK